MKTRRAKEISLISKMIFLIAAFCLMPSCSDFKRLMNKNGTLLRVEVKTDEPNIEQVTESAVKVMQNRLNALNIDGEVEKTLANRLEIKIYGDADADLPRIKKILLAESKFELRKAVSPPSPMPLQTYPRKESAIASLGGAIPPNRKILPFAEFSGSDGQWLVVEDPPVIDGRELIDASVYTDSSSGGGSDYEIMFSLNSAGTQKLGDWTGKNINNYLAIVLNDEVKSAAFIKSQIFDSGVIEGRFTRQAAEDLALVMKSGYLPASFQIVDENKF